MADGAASQTWASPLHDVLARYENAERTVGELKKEIKGYLTSLRSDEKLNDRQVHGFIELLKDARGKLEAAQDQHSFYKVMSPISNALDTTYRQIITDRKVFLDPVEVFEPKGTFKELLRPEAKVPRNLASSSTLPDFLTHGLEERFSNDTPLFQDIVDGRHESPVGFYGTSGAGKTRSIFEIFARSYGLYFVAADARTLNPGSSDVEVIYDKLEEFVEKSTQVENKKILSVYINALILCRLLVFCALRHALNSLGKELTCELWLRVQLAPRHYFGRDVFTSLLYMFVDSCSLGVGGVIKLSERMTHLEPSLDLVWQNTHRSIGTIKFNVAMDEANVLARKFMGYFVSSEDQGQERSLLSPIFKTLREIVRERKLTYHPIFSGTGFLIAHIITQLSSATGKGSLNDTLHYDFKSLDKDGVKAYLESILDLSQLDKNIVEYTCRWLTGRPRWTVAFIDLLLERVYAENTDLNTMFLEHIRRFVTFMTQPNAFSTASTNERESRLFWRYGASSTARHTIEWFKADTNADRLNKIKEALVMHLFTDQSAPLSGEFTPDLVNVGMCQVSTVTHGRSRRNTVDIHVTFEEPLILEAALHSFLEDNSLPKFVKDAILTRERDNTKPPAVYMEYYTVLCAFKNMESTLDNAKYVIGGEDDEDPRERPFEELEMPTRSSFGKLVRNCSQDLEGTLDWLENMNEFSSLGLMDFVEPFCYPFNNFGADVITMMHRTSVTDLTSDEAFVPVMIQVKHPNPTEDATSLNDLNRKALLSVFPELVFRSKTISEAYEYNGAKYNLFHWGVYNKKTLEKILDRCQQFFRVSKLDLSKASDQRKNEVEAENQYMCNGNGKELSCTEFQMDLDWQSRRRPVIMMVCQTGPGSDFLTSFLRHPGHGDADPRQIAISDLDNLSENIQALDCSSNRCEEGIHDIFLAIDGVHGKLTDIF